MMGTLFDSLRPANRTTLTVKIGENPTSTTELFLQDVALGVSVAMTL